MRIAVFCGSSRKSPKALLESARIVGQELGRRRHTLIYGGGRTGLMGAVADAALAAGGRVIGVIPQSLVEREVAHPGLSQLVVVNTLFERKQEMMDRSDAFCALPGGLGTLDELFEVITWEVLGMQHKPCALFNVGGYYDPLLDFLHGAMRADFIKQKYLDALRVETTAERLLAALDAAGGAEEPRAAETGGPTP